MQATTVPEGGPTGFWTISSNVLQRWFVLAQFRSCALIKPGSWPSGFRVQVRGDRAVATDPFKVLKEKAGDDENKGDSSGKEDGAGDGYGTTRILEFDDQP